MGGLLPSCPRVMFTWRLVDVDGKPAGCAGAHTIESRARDALAVALLDVPAGIVGELRAVMRDDHGYSAGRLLDTAVAGPHGIAWTQVRRI